MAILRKFEVEDFMSLRNTSVSLEPLTVFVGNNASGKSAFLKSVVTVCRLQRIPVRGGPLGQYFLEHDVSLDDAVWAGDTSRPIRFRVWFGGRHRARLHAGAS